MSASEVDSLPGIGVSQNEPEQLWQQRIQDAENYRRRFEPAWLSNLAFVAGRQWDVYDRFDRTLRHISEVDPRYAHRELYTADIIHENRGAAMGEMQTDSDRPELLLPGDGESDPTDEDIQAQVNRAIGHGWEYEWDGDGTLEDARFKCVDLGVSAVRVWFDKDAGSPRMDQSGQRISAPVGPDGYAITDASKAREHVAGLAGTGQTASFQDLSDGKICLETGSAFNILAPPGVPHEKSFPWEIWVQALPLEEIKARYPKAATLAPDGDIVSVLGLGMRNSAATSQLQDAPVKLREYGWLYTCYERPTKKFPKGQVVVLGSGQKKLLEQTPALPYQCVDGTWGSGIVYLHWNRLTDRFYSRSLIEALKDPQRLINRRQTQSNEIIDRGMPFTTAEEGSYVEQPNGTPMEIRYFQKGTSVQPQSNPGIGPGDWMYRDKQELRNDAAHASTLSALKLGENPENVTTYSQLAILNEQEAGKRSTIRNQHERATCDLVEYLVIDVKRYWPESKQIMVAGEENRLQAETFLKSKIPPLFVVRPASGSAKPRGQGAQLQVVTDIWNGAVASGATVQNPGAWVEWYKKSLEAGEAVDLPTPPVDNQSEKAQIENHTLLAGGEPAVAYWDNITIHLPIHREAEDQAILSGDLEAIRRIEQHIQEHQQVAAQNQAQVMAQQPPPMAGTPGEPPMPGGAPQPGAPPMPQPGSPPAATPPGLAPPTGT